jgi:digeranylgeranylglycerophospholipid reductase
MAAMRAAEGGARTLLLEKHPQIGRPVCCAEAITTTGLERVIKPRPEWVAAVIEGAQFVSPSGASMKFYHSAAGFILHRELFDAGLAGLAAEAGAEVVTDATAIAVQMAGNSRIEKITVAQSGAKFDIGAKVIIAADGIESRIAYMAGIDTEISLRDIDSACQYLIGDIAIKEMLITVAVGNEIAPGGYAWIFPKSSSTANVGVSICPEKAPRKKAKYYLDRFTASHFPGGNILRTTMGCTPSFNRNMPLLKGNLMIVGDAARVLDSLSGAGISNALISGSIAGNVAAKWLKGEDELKSYPQEFMRLKARELSAYKIFRSLFIQSNDSDLETIFRAVDDYFPEKKVRDINLPDIIFKLILKKPSLLAMARYLVMK